MTDYYADMIGNITVTGPLVRIDFLSQASPAPHQPPSQQGAQFQLAHRLVMPLDGFLRSLGVQEQIRAKLIEDGIVKVEQKGPAASAETTH